MDFSRVLCIAIFFWSGESKSNAADCPQESSMCEFWLTIEEKLTMMYGKSLVYAKKGKLYKFDEHPSNFTTKIPLSEVITGDGYYRMLTTVNGTLPGPPLIVYEHQQIRVHVANKLLSHATTIHWHGMHMQGTPYMDGVAYLTQCPVGPGQTFTYEFKAEPRGTFWYHSHIGAQRTNGVYGALIVKERSKPGIKYPHDLIMTVGDWHHYDSTEVYVRRKYGNFIKGKQYERTETLDGLLFSVPWVSALIEGRGRYYDPKSGVLQETPLTKYTVTKGEEYRFRVIATGVMYPLRISVDDHSLLLLASDGYDLKERVVESIVISPGERFDFLLVANMTVGNYWIRAVSMEDKVTNHSVEAILHYQGANDAEPTTQRRKCLEATPCVVANCHFRHYPAQKNTVCINFDELESKEESSVPVFDPASSKEIFLNFAFPGEEFAPASVNGRQFTFPGVSSLSQPNDIGDYDCNKHNCGEDRICTCHYTIDLPRDQTIQMVWLGMGEGVGLPHPIHLHGHSFQVIKVAHAIYDPQTAKKSGHNPDINCGGNPAIDYCNNARWSNSSWSLGKIPGLNLKNPPIKDTVTVPSGGYVVIRFRSNNPGRWLLHCHFEVHSLDGMAMVINEAPGYHPRPPHGFPVCKSFYNDRSRDIDFIRAHEVHRCPFGVFQTTLIVVGSVLATICAVQVIIICHLRRKSTMKPVKEIHSLIPQTIS